jgi:protein TonB
MSPPTPVVIAPSFPVVAPSGVGPELATEPAPPSIADIGLGELIGSPEVARELVRPEDLAPPPVVPKVPAPIRITSGLEAPRKVHDQAPVYPQPAILAHVEGTVIIEAVISTSGAVQEMRVLRSLPFLDQAALDAVRQWVFTPTRLHGVAVPVILTVNVQFKLQ